jgi:hypothetical protein
MCLPTAPALPPIENGDFGMSPFCGQLSDKSQLAFAFNYGRARHEAQQEYGNQAPRTFLRFSAPLLQNRRMNLYEARSLLQSFANRILYCRI